MEKKWNIATPAESAVRHLVSHLHCHPATAAALINRGITDPATARRFWDAPLAELRPPFAMAGMDRTIRRITQSLVAHEPILIFGDYDVDGITATTILYDFLTRAGGRISYYIPHRIHEGYGMRARHIPEVALPREARLIITVDCGIGSHEAVLAANAAGIDVIVTDHHEPSESLPAAHAVINPKQADCRAGFQYLAGVGVVFCLLAALRRHLRTTGFSWPRNQEPNLRRYLDLVALGTIADMVPLTADNRILSKNGLQVLNTQGRIGLKALADTAGLGKGRGIDAEDIAFRLAPRLNAAGRMDHAVNAVRLLSATDPDEARRISLELAQFNTNRQVVEQGIMAQIEAHIENHPDLLAQNALIFAKEGWHTGVLGIVASRLVRAYHRPAILISLSEGVGKGSGRSIPGLDLHAALCRCHTRLRGFGGHAQAVGLELTAEALPCFKTMFHQAVADIGRSEDFAQRVFVDGRISFDEIDIRLAEEIERLQPFGSGNAEPVFLSQNVQTSNPVIIAGSHRRVRLSQQNGRFKRTFNAMEFNFSGDLPPDGTLAWVAFRIRRNTWGGKDAVQLFLEAY